MNTIDIYNPMFVRDLFNNMSRTYGFTNFIASFGFCQRWRKQCVAQAPLQPGMLVCDLMTGMGECWPPIRTALQSHDQLCALDFSPEMCRRASADRPHLVPLAVTVLENDAFFVSFATGPSDDGALALGGEWNAQPRSIQVMSDTTSLRRYESVIQAFLQQNGVAEPAFVQQASGDPENNGKLLLISRVSVSSLMYI